MAMRLEMMCSPPAKRSTAASSAALTLVFDDLDSGQLFFHVSGQCHQCPSTSRVVGVVGVIRGRGRGA